MIDSLQCCKLSSDPKDGSAQKSSLFALKIQKPIVGQLATDVGQPVHQ